MSPRKGLDRKTIVAAAAELADAAGFDEITMASLAAKLGVRSPSLYNHVDGLSALRTELALFGLEKLYAALAEALGDKAGDEALHALAVAYISFGRRHPGVYALTLRSPDKDNTEYMELADKLVGLLVQTLQDYEADRERAIHFVRGFRSLLHGFVSIERQGGFGMAQAIDDSVRLVLQAYLDGLRTYRK
jgi:AcrR family transcriptional regulator